MKDLICPEWLSRKVTVAGRQHARVTTPGRSRKWSRSVIIIDAVMISAFSL
jgi:hypothetical protein